MGQCDLVGKFFNVAMQVGKLAAYASGAICWTNMLLLVAEFANNAIGII